MAQDFVGSYNINVLVPSGAFGSRIAGGEDHASARYIQTYVTPEITRSIYRELDEPVLNYLDDDGIPIEPEWFIPVIPMILVNGTKGIGTGFSTTVAKYNPLDIIHNLFAMINNKVDDIKELKPWYQGFKGTVLTSNKPGSYLIYGRYQVVDDITVRVTELPVGVWTNDYKEFLESEITKKNIVSYTSNNTDESVEFTVVFEEDKLKKMVSKKELYTKLKLISRISTNNMWLYDPSGMIKKYSDPQDIINEFYQVRLAMYTKRKEWLISKITNELDILKYKMKFIKFVLDGKIVVFKQKRSVIIEKLDELKFPKLSTKQSGKVEVNPDSDSNTDSDSQDNSSKSYEYITTMPLFSLTEERITELQTKLDEKEQELKIVEETSETDQWKTELNEVLEIYKSWSQIKQEVVDAIASGKVIKDTKSSKSIKSTKSTKSTKKSIDI
jgi:DNA topoisomerase-2